MIYPPPNASTPIYAVCNMSDTPAYMSSCNPLTDGTQCAYNQNDLQSLTKLCSLICAGCSA